MAERRPLSERFWEKVDRRDGDECWEWTASTDRCGYGRLTIAGDVERAHRVSYALTFGQFASELRVLHRCDNPPCVNPSHLFLGTQADNVADMKKKGRERKNPAKGSDAKGAKLTSEKVIEIRRLMDAGASQNRIAADFGISNGHAWRVGNRVRWAHLGES